MSDKTGIEWTDATWNPLRARFTDPITGAVRIGWHCEHASEGCRFCYAEQINKGFFQLGTKQPYARPSREEVEIFLDEDTLTKPLRWKKPRMVFVCSMTDLFGEWHTDEQIDRIFAVMALAPQHTFQVLTKRAERMAAYIDRIAEMSVRDLDEHFTKLLRDFDTQLGDDADAIGRLNSGPLDNVWLGVSAEDQKNADERIPWLLKTSAAVRFLSVEPLLGPIPYLASWLVGCSDVHLRPRPERDRLAKRDPLLRSIDWVIAGGESGPNARPMHPDWARSVRDQCLAAGVPFFFKQNGEYVWRETWGDSTGKKHTFDDGVFVNRVGKKAAGSLLDGKEWKEFPCAS